MKHRAWGLIALVALPAVAFAQKSPEPPATPSEPVSHGASLRGRAAIEGTVAIGVEAEDFELDGSRGVPVKLSRLRGDWVLLAFSDRKERLAELRTLDQRIARLGARLVGICHEMPGPVQSYAERDSIPFLILADYTGEISGLYGLYDHQHSQTVPGYLMLDRHGRIRMALLGEPMPPDDLARLVQATVTGL